MSSTKLDYLTNMSVTAALTSKVNSTDGTDDVLASRHDFVNEETFFVLKVDITSVAVFVQRLGFLVVFHRLDRDEEAGAVIEGTGHLSLGYWSGHLGW